MDTNNVKAMKLFGSPEGEPFIQFQNQESETPSDGDINPTPSEVIDEFDSNDIIFDEAAIKEV